MSKVSKQAHLDLVHLGLSVLLFSGPVGDLEARHHQFLSFMDVRVYWKTRELFLVAKIMTIPVHLLPSASHLEMDVALFIH